MAVIWADFPSGQRGMYGTNTARMLNGIWADTGGMSLVADPDPSIDPGGIVLALAGSDLAPTLRGARFAYPVPAYTQGLSVRIWMNALPTGNDFTMVIAFRDITNTTKIAMRILSTGAVEFRSVDGESGGTQFGVTTGPVLTANAWNQVEMKTLSHASAGTIEMRVNNVVKLNLAGLNTSGVLLSQVVVGNNTGFSTNSRLSGYYKDLILWDTTGTRCNDFLGQVGVFDTVTDGDDDLQWVPSFGATGHNLTRDDKPAGTLTATGTISDGDVVKIDTTYYRFSTANVDTGAPAGTNANPWRVLINGSVAAALINLHKAIGALGVAGTDYSTALVAHTTVDPQGYTATTVGVSAKLLTASAISTTETGANLAWGATTLIDGPTDSSYISADASPPAPNINTMTDLPPDVTSVKAVLPIARMAKSDGGDCQVEIAVSPNGADWDAGADRAITVASTFFWDVSHESPDTGVPWTPTEVNDMVLRADRTV